MGCLISPILAIFFNELRSLLLCSIMVLERFTIVLDNVDATYFPGQQITGNVHIWNNIAKNVKGIYVECRGFARVCFSTMQQRSRTIHRRGRSHLEVTNTSVNHKSSEDYFYQRVALKVRGNERWEMHQGRHQYPFSFTLPNEIPSSFEGVDGHVRYTIRAVFQRRRKWNHECKLPFTVNSIMDLNKIPESRMVVEVSDFKTLGLFCCQSNPITARFWLDRMGYVPGEKIYFNAEVENLSRKTMHGSKFQLIERTNFHAMGKTQSRERVIREFERGQFNDAELWENYPISVPPVVASELRFCRIIDVDYRIVFTVDPGPFSFNLSISHTILIGNVPFRSSFPDFQGNEYQLNATAAISESATMLEHNDNPFPADSSSAITVTDYYPDLPPPTYEECMFGGDIRDAEDSEHVNYGAGIRYNPRYLTYG